MLLAELHNSSENRSQMSVVLSLQLEAERGCRLCWGVELCGAGDFGAVRLVCRETISEERISTTSRFPSCLLGEGQTIKPSNPIPLSHIVLDDVDTSCMRSRVGFTSRNRRLRWIFIFLPSCTCIFSFLPFLSDSQRSFLSRDALSPCPECPVHVGAVGCFPTESRCPPLSCFSRH